MTVCTAEFARLAALAGDLQCDGGNPVLLLHNPFTLLNWTFPLIELLLLAGAAACLVHAVRWYRASGDTSNLVVWLSSVAALLIVEPITYFPQWFGLEEEVGLAFIHGQFSVQFFYDRLPLYIVAMYPVFGYVAYVLVQRTGILERNNPLVGGVCVAFGFMCLFEVIDTIGPQWGWWIWNPEHHSANPSLGPIPYVSLQAFSLVVPFAIAFISIVTTRRQPGTRWRFAANVAIVSVGVWPLMIAIMVPSKLFELVGLSAVQARGVSTWLTIGVVTAVTAWAMHGAYRARRENPALVPQGARDDRFALVCVAVYLGFGLMFWLAGLSDFLAARGGHTAGGYPTGSAPWAIVNFFAAIAFVTVAYRGTMRTADDVPSRRSGQPA